MLFQIAFFILCLNKSETELTAGVLKKKIQNTQEAKEILAQLQHFTVFSAPNPANHHWWK